MMDFDPITKPAEEPAPEPTEAKEPASEPKRKAKKSKGGGEYRVPKGKAITTRRGIRGEGEVITARDVSGGREKLDALVDAGLLERS